ncbi:unnamed protein product [Cylindrotheca closterium]|uniref:Uncharacterized protein n=1 Tax=Cylindrotheca closterium TaxID=2856 RepID=A0AAD2CLR6_9STRA|nr:unnamed protein product [Cylindrotheca closterium]
MGQAPSSYTEGAERDDLRKNFLKTHRPEQEAKWILDRSEVGAALMYQADEIMKLKGMSCDEIYEGNKRNDFQRTDSGLLLGTTSSVVSNIFSDTTTATDTTLPTKNNIKRYHPRANSTNEMNPYGDERDEDDLVIMPMSDMLSPSSSKLPQLPTAERTDGIFNIYSKLVSACAQPKEEWQLRREELMTVLHLRMKAYLGRYFLDRFLPMFPSFGSTLVEPSRPRQHDPEDTDASDGLTFNAFEPASPLNYIYHSIPNSPFMDLGFTGSLNLVSRSTTPSRAFLTEHQKNPSHYIVLVNRRSGVPIAVCARKMGSGKPPVVRIYATRRRVFGQLAAASTEKLGLDWSENLPLYPWAEIVTETMYPNPLTFSIYMSAGSDGRFAAKPSYEAHLAIDPEPVVKLSGKTDAERQPSGSALISLRIVDGENGRSKVQFSIDVAQGIDPALVLCFAAVLDEILEVSMFLQCQARSAH